MNAKSVSNSVSVNDLRRCQHRTSTGKRCRLAVVDSYSGLCHRHAAFHSDAATSADLRAILAGDITEFEDVDCRHPEGLKGLELAGLLD